MFIMPLLWCSQVCVSLVVTMATILHEESNMTKQILCSKQLRQRRLVVALMPIQTITINSSISIRQMMCIVKWCCELPTLSVQEQHMRQCLNIVWENSWWRLTIAKNYLNGATVGSICTACPHVFAAVACQKFFYTIRCNNGNVC